MYQLNTITNKAFSRTLVQTFMVTSLIQAIHVMRSVPT
ncbi:hypothetical protein EVA_16212 [gut metagenome]|uniref:Uncharacterized protein n=1 Tax=gut metagenome TaxID=749906 RepID=J9C764_9ZZZZ